ncbi:MAG: substrate-binding domain-containing protein [Actinobacteria bacterium]|nr:substrate-binding domain-containing protein [Actinomycetota bacterium]
MPADRLDGPMSGDVVPRAGSVGVLINDLTNPWFVDLLAGLASTLHGAGLAPVLADNHTDQRVGAESVDTFLALDVSGIVVVGSRADDAAIVAAATRVPVVLAGTREPVLEHSDIVVNDDLAGASLAARHLIELGHTRIAHLRGPGEIGRLRYEGFVATLSEAGLDPERYLEAGGPDEESGYAAARRILSRRDRPTAILAYNDMSAIGTLSAADDLGLWVPQDVSVVGYDNTSLAKIGHLSLTSVTYGTFPVGEQAGRFLVERLARPDLPSRLHLVPSSLEVRESTAPPRS